MRVRRPLHRKPAGTEVVWGIHLSFLSADLVEFCGELGFEWLFLDAEHMPVTPALCRELVRAADLAGMFCVVRVAEISAPLIEGFLDIGVLGILAPNVSTAAQARALVAAVKFGPQGTRGAASRSRAAHYGLAQSASDYYREANHTTFTAALIESQSGLDHLESILAVPGLDYVSIGPSDLALSLGIGAGLSDPLLRTIVEDSQARIKAFGKPRIAVVSDTVQARAAAEGGAGLVAVSDAALFERAGRSFMQAARDRGTASHGHR